MTLLSCDSFHHLTFQLSILCSPQERVQGQVCKLGSRQEAEADWMEFGSALDKGMIYRGKGRLRKAQGLWRHWKLATVVSLCHHLGFAGAGVVKEGLPGGGAEILEGYSCYQHTKGWV